MAERAPAAEDLLARWCDHLAAAGRGRRTIVEYRADVGRFLGFLGDHLGAAPGTGALGRLGISDFRAWMAWEHGRGLSAASRARAASAVRGFFAWLDAEEGVTCDAVAALSTPKVPPRQPRPVEAEAARTLIGVVADLHPERWVGARDAALLTLIWGAGLRMAEALGLKQSDAPLGETVRVTGKGGRLRDVPVLPVSRAAVETYRDLCPHAPMPDEALFLGMRGGALEGSLARKAMRRARETLGLPTTATPHALRHAFATQLLNSGGDLRAVQQLLGHASLRSTQVYTEVMTERMQRVYAQSHPRARNRGPDDGSD